MFLTITRSLLVSLLISTSLFAQTSRKKRTPKIDLSGKTESPCGVRQSIEEFIEEIRLDWRIAAETDEQTWLYSTKIVCDNKILKIWVKVIPKGKIAPYPHSMQRYEINCRSDQYRLMSVTEYSQGGKSLGTFRGGKNPDWEDAIPDSVMEEVVHTVCHHP